MPNPPPRPDRMPRRRPAAESGPQLSPDMMLEMAYDFLRQRGIYAVPLGLVLGAAAAYFIFSMMPPTFKAVAQVNVTAPPYVPLTEFKNGQMAFITTPPVLNAALDKPEARALDFVQQSANPVADLGSMVKLETIANSPVIDITMEGQDPKTVQVLVNAVLDAYLEKASTLMNQNASEEIGKLRDKITQTETERTVLEGRKRFHARSVGSEDPLAVERELLEVEDRLVQIKESLARIEDTHRQRESDYNALKQKQPELTAQDLMMIWSQNRVGDPAQVQRIDQYKYLAQRVAETSKKGWNDPTAIAYLQRAREMQNSLTQGNPDVAKQLLEQRAKELDARRESLLRELDALVQQYSALQSEQVNATDRKRKLETVVSDVRQIDAQVGQLNRDIEKLADRLRSEELNYLSRYLTKLTDAALPTSPSLSSKKVLVLAAAFVGPNVLVLGFFALGYFRRRLITRAEHAQAMLSVPVLGTLPQIPTGIRLPKNEDFLPSNRDAHKWIAMQEAINSLRITLTFGADHRGQGLNSLMVTSARDSEGKSTLSAQLAVSLARSGVRVILIEADLYRPTQYEAFGVSREPGITDVLQGDKTLDEVIVETQYPGLDLLTAGTASADVPSLLTRNRLQEIMDALRDQYETILVDAPPVLPVSDALILGQVVDEAILAVMCNHSQVHAVQQTCQRLEGVGVPVRGVVVTGTPPLPKYYEAYYNSYTYGGYGGGPGKKSETTKGEYRSQPPLADPEIRPARRRGLEQSAEDVESTPKLDSASAGRVG